MRRRDFIAGLFALPMVGFVAPALARVPKPKLCRIVDLERDLEFVTITVEVAASRMMEALSIIQHLVGKRNAARLLGFARGELMLHTASGTHNVAGIDADHDVWRVSMLFVVGEPKRSAHHFGDFDRLGFYARFNFDVVSAAHFAALL